MAAPSHVPIRPDRVARGYTSTPHVPSPWTPGRAGELDGPQPLGDRLGTPGPDAGYAITLADRLVEGVDLVDERREDVVAGLAAVAAKRAALFGRAPVIHDVRVAAIIWGYTGASHEDLVDLRRRVFEGVGNAHHYEARRALADRISADLLRRTPERIAEMHRTDWVALVGGHSSV